MGNIIPKSVLIWWLWLSKELTSCVVSSKRSGSLTRAAWTSCNGRPWRPRRPRPSPYSKTVRRLENQDPMPWPPEAGSPSCCSFGWAPARHWMWSPTLWNLSPSPNEHRSCVATDWLMRSSPASVIGSCPCSRAETLNYMTIPTRPQRPAM